MVAIAFGLVESNVETSNTKIYGNRLRTLPCYFAMFGLAELFELLMGLDALKLRNIIQLIGILIFHAMLIVSAGLQIHQTRTALVNPVGTDNIPANPMDSCDDDGYKTCSGPNGLFALVEKFLIVVPVILGLYHEFGWAVFHAIGADPRMKEMYRWYQIMICLLKFDFFCFVALTMQLLIVVLDRSSAEFGLTVAAIPIVLILLIACGLAVQREIKWLMTGSLILMLGAQAYFLYKFSRLFIGQTREQYVSTRATLATVSIIAFLMIFASFAVGLRCFADFDKGLMKSKTNPHAMRIEETLDHPDGQLELRLEDVVNDDGESSDDMDGDHVGNDHERSLVAPPPISISTGDPSGHQQPFDHAALEAQITDLLTAEATRPTRRAAAAAAAARQHQRNTNTRTNDPQSTYPLSLAALPIGYPPQGTHDSGEPNDPSAQHTTNPSIPDNSVVSGVLDGPGGHPGSQPQNFADITDILAHLSAHLETAAAAVAAQSQPGPLPSSGGEDDEDSLPDGHDDEDEEEPAQPAASTERALGHDGEEDFTRPFVCDIPGCGKGFGRKSDLARHLRIHSGERPYPCDEPGCGKSFIQRSALNVHKRVHTGEKPHVCEYSGCDKTFGDSSSLARHRRTHTGRRPYKCDEPLCDKTFTRRTTLNRHMRVHMPGFDPHSRPSKRRRTDEELTDIPAIGSFITPRAALPGGVRPVPQMSHSTMVSLGSGNNAGASGSDVQLDGSTQPHHDPNQPPLAWPAEHPTSDPRPHSSGSGAENGDPNDSASNYPDDWMRNMNGGTEPEGGSAIEEPSANTQPPRPSIISY
ncbi:unnamed protein product [Rhizoctonia solani]|uniref:C2H2-type domain-containing protein n=1 Tax=Rhizoctonia solani TaxID=456999 RepID=A0A8H2WL87_9AGAM|nr:unnamed protein product [Rhizoctonia solani]